MSARRIFASGRRETKFGHGRYLNTITTSRTTDNQEKVVSDVLRERARRALYADCDRAPLGWENAAA
ncbi:hypothetical protein [Erythrobacter crassostreae]|uniref:Uncharacterized protein n=1 Tax=Erythrobacter crassostreae TaxID=2828328 RepID=A0A9X1F5H9_9SPHN|nr:hypothetical protein [Erythrobacter crassostrea]MBV7259683.1 hypothetical protein [Erythrobacter crassostrea]